ncbi:MAG: NAD(P) transhydrogenase subunit alpha [Planctomycetota bacterium]
MAHLVLLAAVFAASLAVGYALIARVPPMLHTPLMSLTNALSAVTIIGALLVFAEPVSWAESAFGALAVAAASFNLAGGFAITDRMLRHFKKKA